MTKPSPSSATPASSSWAARPAVAALLIFAAVLFAWSNSFTAPFEFDDHASIIDNATIRHLWPATWLRPPTTAGETVSGRPVLNFTLAVNYAIGGLDVRGYHAVNLLIHAGAALALLGIVRRTLALPFFAARPPAGPAFALVVALLWALHPLQVESVTYVVQRAESLAGLLSLLTLYCFIRGTGGWSPTSGRAEEGTPAKPARRSGSTNVSGLWFAGAVASCLLGVGAKETVVVMPVIVLLYDWTFLAGTLRGAWQARGRVYAALVATWLPLAVLVLGFGGNRGGTFSFTPEGFGHYWVAQLKAVTCYLGLVVWPAPLVFDRAFFRIEHLAEAVPYALVILVLVGATLAGVWKRTAAGFLGACFFIILAPSSLMPGLLQVIVEHRMYLALAAPVVLLAALAGRLLPRFAGVLAVLAVGALGAATFARNQVYRSTLALWQDTAAKSPANPRAHYNLGLELRSAGRTNEAVIEFERTLALQPNHALAYFELGKIDLRASRWLEAAGYFQAALAADPHFVDARVNFAESLAGLDRPGDAIAQYRAALAEDPDAADIRTNLAGLLVQQDQLAEGAAMLREVIAKVPDLAEAHYHLGIALAKSGAADAAEAEFRTTVRLKPAFPAAQRALGNALAARGDAPGAEAAYREALRLDDDDAAETWYALGNLEAKQQRFAEAMGAYRAALERDPDHVPARNNLANCQLATGRFDDAIAGYEAVLRARPGDPTVQRNLDLARELKRTGGRNR